MITAEIIKKKAEELGATVCGIGSLDIFEGEDIQKDPKMILPNAKCIIGLVLPYQKDFILQWILSHNFIHIPQWV